MNKFLVVFLGFALASQAFAACPELKGEYLCFSRDTSERVQFKGVSHHSEDWVDYQFEGLIEGTLRQSASSCDNNTLVFEKTYEQVITGKYYATRAKYKIFDNRPEDLIELSLSETYFEDVQKVGDFSDSYNCIPNN
jgi:hypothetical protein